MQVCKVPLSCEQLPQRHQCIKGVESPCLSKLVHNNGSCAQGVWDPESCPPLFSRQMKAIYWVRKLKATFTDRSTTRLTEMLGILHAYMYRHSISQNPVSLSTQMPSKAGCSDWNGEQHQSSKRCWYYLLNWKHYLLTRNVKGDSCPLLDFEWPVIKAQCD